MRAVDTPESARIGCYFGALLFGAGGLRGLLVTITAMRAHTITVGREAKVIEAAQDPVAFDQALQQQWFGVVFLLGIAAAFLYLAKKLES